MNKPDILLISVDTMRRDCMAPYGHDLMPEATRLLAEGVSFRKAVATAPWTGPSFGSIFTGLWPRNHGCITQRECGKVHGHAAALRGDVPYLFGILHEAGYQTCCAQGNNGYLGPGCGFLRDFDSYAVWPGFGNLVKERGWLGAEREAIRYGGLTRWLEHVWMRLRAGLSSRSARYHSVMTSADSLVSLAFRHLQEADQDRPVCLWINFMDMHMPYAAPRKYMKKPAPPGKLRPVHIWPLGCPEADLSERDKEYTRHRYHNTARYVNDAIARLFAAWRTHRGQKERLTVFLSDHGEEFWDHGDDMGDPESYRRGTAHGHTHYNELIHVPLVFHWPQRLDGGKVVEGLASMADVTPTLLSLLDVDAVAQTDVGVSQLDQLTGGENTDTTRVVFSEAIAQGPERLAAIDHEYKLVRRVDDGQEELYAWAETDPREQNNLIDDVRHQDVRQRLADALQRWEQQDQAEQSESQPGLSADEEQALQARLRELGYI